MKRVLVIGASGGMGYAIVKELVSRETFQIVAFARTQSKLEKLFGNDSNVIVHPGDVFNVEELRAAAHGAEIIFHALSVPYHEWEARQPVLLNNILSVAKEVDAKLVVVDNIYAYGRADGEKVREDFPKRPHTKKGKIRLQLENMVRQSGVQFLIAHFPDFYGPYAENTLLHETFKRVVQNKKTMFVGNPEIPREFIYTPDGAKALVELSLRNHTYGQNWNVPGAGLITGNEILQILRRWGYSKGMSSVNRFMVRMAGLFNKDMREYVEMFYLNEHPVVLSGEKLEKELGQIPRTPYETGIIKTLEALQSSPVSG
jgi:nucleoside-diphosphate-sugar epimerase